MLASLRYAVRNLGRHPLFTVVALVSIGLGIGANTAIFSLLDQLLLRALPAREPAQLVQLDLPGTKRGFNFNDRAFSYPMYRAMRDNTTAFSGLWAQFVTPVHIAGKGASQRVDSLLVSGNYFDTLGLQPALGRLLHQTDDESQGGHPVAVVSYGFWREKLGGDLGVLDKEVLINGQKYAIVGVAPEHWRGTNLSEQPDVYLPLAMKRQITPTWDGMDSSEFYFLHVFGRLNKGVTAEQAKPEVDAILAPVLIDELAKLKGLSEKRAVSFLSKRIVLYPAVRGNLSDRETIATATWTLMALVGVVLLIACANVANLLLARGSSRKKEIAIRLALGASRGQLVRQLLVESMVLAGLGGLLGLLFSDWILAGIITLQTGIDFRSAFDWRTLLFTGALTFSAGILFGLLPAMQATKANVAPTIKDQAGSLVGGNVWLRKALVVGQISLSVILLAAAGLFTKTLFELRQASPGFRSAELITFSLDPSLNGYNRVASEQLHSQIQNDLGRLPSVRNISLASSAILDNSILQRTISVPGYAAQEGEDMNPRINELAPGFFKTLEIPVLLGREFNPADSNSAPKVAIVNEAFARHYFKGANPIGRVVRLGGRDHPPDMMIVGMVANSKHANPREDAAQFRFLYLPMAQAEDVAQMHYYVRTTDDSMAVAKDIQGIVRRRDPNLPIVALRTVREQIDRTLAMERLISTLCSSFGLVATLLASIGLYGVMAFHVAQRTREIGIRMALGASRTVVLAMILREVAGMAALGVLIGVLAALGLGQLVKSLLFPTQPADPVVLSAAALLLAAVALAAGWIPARRASGIDPMHALRYE